MEIGQLGSSSSPGFNAVGSSASMLFRIGGTEAMRIDPNRRVGIGTASPSYLLDVYTQSNDIARFSGINGGSLLFRNASTNKVSLNAQSGDFLTFGTNGNSERLRIDTSGRVLINTSIEGEASAENLTIGDSSDCGISLRSGSTSSGKISFSDAYAGAAEYAGFLEYDHNVNALLLGTNSVERLRIDSSGRVGIGTNSPSDVLTVAGTDAFIKVDRSNGNPGIDFRYNGSTTNRGLIDVTSTGALKFAAGGNTERMRIDSSGNVGIGTTSPSAKLDVAGEVQCDSLDVDGAADISGAVTLHANLDLQDNDRIRIGNGDDLQLYHNVYDSYIDNHLGDLAIRNLADDKDIRLISDNGSGGTTDYVLCDGSSGEVKLYHYGTRKLSTKSTGIQVVGTVTDLYSYGNLRDIPQNSKPLPHTLVVGDAGKHINITTGGVTVPSGVFSTGDAVTIYNDSSSDQTVTQGHQSLFGVLERQTPATVHWRNAAFVRCSALLQTSSLFLVRG